MNTTIPNWQSVTAERFVAVLATFDYERSAWSNAIEYIEKRTGKIIGYEVGDRPPYDYRLHPGLAVETIHEATGRIFGGEA